MTELLNSLLSGELNRTTLLGAVIALDWIAISALWWALYKERQRGEDLVNKMLDMTTQTAIMIERITGRT